ncbi:Tetratricopeptide repeat protein 36 [Podila clonocystis]|nr:Tetratricopeptide repeat protein 36 [Podila clonocystis]
MTSAKTPITAGDAKILDMVFNPEGTMLPDKETETMLRSEPTVIEPELLKKLKSLEAEAVLLAEKDDIDGAIAKFTEIIDLCPTYASAYNNRAQAYRIQDNTEAAIKDLDKAIEHGNGQTAILKQAYTQRAIIKKLKGDKDGAQVDFERGARFGNPVAKAISVQDNPISQLCGAMVMEMLNKELKGDKNYIDVHGTKDPMLKGLARDDTPDDASGHFSHRSEDEENLANLSSAYEGDDSDGGIDSQVAKTAFKKTASMKTTSKTTKLVSNVDYTGHGAISHIENELHQAKNLAQQLEETLHGHSRHSPNGHDHTSGHHHRSHTHEKSEHKYHHHHHHDNKHHRKEAHDREHGGFLSQVWTEWRHFPCAGFCSLAQIVDKLHSVGSTSRGLVLLTLLLETAVFVTAAYDGSGASGDHWYNSWWALVTNWKNFLWPFFVYYGTLFVLPTLLSQLFNVDISRPQHTRHHRDHGSGPSTGTTVNTTHAMTGLLSPKTTSGLSYFVFKFAITYLLMPRNHGSHYSGIWQGCKALYEYVPATVGLAISGVGVVLALAESVVSA